MACHFEVSDNRAKEIVMRIWMLRHSRQPRSLAHRPLRKGQIEKLAAAFIGKVFLENTEE